MDHVVDVLPLCALCPVMEAKSPPQVGAAALICFQGVIIFPEKEEPTHLNLFIWAVQSTNFNILESSNVNLSACL